jgi:hypothetical protein
MHDVTRASLNKVGQNGLTTHFLASLLVCMYVCMYVCKTLFKDTSPVNGALVSTGGVYNVKNYKRY